MFHRNLHRPFTKHSETMVWETMWYNKEVIILAILVYQGWPARWALGAALHEATSYQHCSLPERMLPALSVNNTMKYCLLENPLPALVVSSRAFLWEIPVTALFLPATCTSPTSDMHKPHCHHPCNTQYEINLQK